MHANIEAMRAFARLSPAERAAILAQQVAVGRTNLQRRQFIVDRTNLPQDSRLVLYLFNALDENRDDRARLTYFLHLASYVDVDRALYAVRIGQPPPGAGTPTPGTGSPGPGTPGASPAGNCTVSQSGNLGGGTTVTFAVNCNGPQDLKVTITVGAAGTTVGGPPGCTLTPAAILVSATCTNPLASFTLSITDTGIDLNRFWSAQSTFNDVTKTAVTGNVQ